jgi:protease-4
VIYADFTQKVAAGRHLPLAQVQDIAKGRVWSGADAQTHGLVDQLGGFWTATDIARKLAGIDASTPVVFKMFPHQKNLWEAMSDLFGNSDQSVSAVRAFVTLMNAAPVKAVVETVADLPKGGVELKATNLPR